MSDIVLNASPRSDIGKGASRRLRRLEGKVPAVVYGGNKKPQSLHLIHKDLVKALESESIYSSVIDLSIDGKKEKVILKDLQRHPYKPLVMHLDLQRVSAKSILVKSIPLHFINEEKAPGVKEGGVFAHSMTQVEVRCEAQALPEFIEVDVSNMELDSILHLTDIVLPKGVEFAIDPTEGGHDHSVVSLHVPKAAPIEEPVSEETEEELAAEEAEAEGEKGADENAEEESAKSENKED